MKVAGFCLIVVALLGFLEFYYFSNMFGLMDSISQTKKNNIFESGDIIKNCFYVQIILILIAGLCLFVEDPIEEKKDN